VALQWLPGLAVDSDDHTVGVTGQINANLNLDLAKLLFNLLLLFGLAPLDVWTELTRDASNLVEERKFSLVKGALFDRET
jgi:hypothetical protein